MTSENIGNAPPICYSTAKITMIEKAEARLLGGIIFCSPGTYLESSFSVHHQRVISLIIHGVLPVNARLLIAFGTAFYAIISDNSRR